MSFFGQGVLERENRAGQVLRIRIGQQQQFRIALLGEVDRRALLSFGAELPITYQSLDR
jgi:hypothetical protein